MDGIENYFGFMLAGIILNLTPGADTIYIITRSIVHGRKAGIYSVLGISTGAICHTILAAFGLSIILMKSVMLFNTIKYLGVIYLVYLGIKMILDKSSMFDTESSFSENTNLLKIYRQGFLTNLLNPKVAIFFLSLLPQFIKPEYVNGPLPFIILGITFITTASTWCLIVAFSASSMTTALRKNDKIEKVLQKVGGAVFIGLGLQLLLKKNN